MDVLTFTDYGEPGSLVYRNIREIPSVTPPVPEFRRDLVVHDITALIGSNGLIYDDIFAPAVTVPPPHQGGKGDNPPGHDEHGHRIVKPTGLLETREMSRREVQEEIARLQAKQLLDDQEAEMLCLLMLLME